MSFGLDAAGHPDAQVVHDSGAVLLGQYVPTPRQAYGINQAQLENYRDAGVPVLVLFEEHEWQYREGYDGGRAFIARCCDGARSIGLRAGIDYEPVVVLEDPAPVAPGEDYLLRQYALGCEDELVAKAVLRYRGYGSYHGLVEVAQPVCPHMVGYMGVRTWGFTFSYDAGCDIVQEPNITPPVAGTDYDSVLVADVGTWPRTLPPPHKESDDMIFQATSDSTTNPAVTTGSAWVLMGTEFLRVDPANYPGVAVLPTDGEAIGRVSMDLVTEADVRRIVDEQLTGRSFDVDPIPPTWSSGARNLANVLRTKARLGKKV